MKARIVVIGALGAATSWGCGGAGAGASSTAVDDKDGVECPA